MYIPERITNLNDFDRIAGFSGLNSSMFTNKDLERLNIWTQIEDSIYAIQRNQQLSRNVFHVNNYLQHLLCSEYYQKQQQGLMKLVVLSNCYNLCLR